MTTLQPGTEQRLRVLAPIAVGLIGLGVWQFLVSVAGVSDYLLPSPAAIVEQFVEFGPASCRRPS